MSHKHSRNFLTSTAALALTAFLPNLTQAQAPQAPTVASGSAVVTQQGATTIIKQGTDRAAIDWRSFSVGPQNTVRFDQPGSSSVTLNRVTGSDPSAIEGRIIAPGQVWLANPNGVLFSRGSRVDVGGLIATTGKIDATGSSAVITEANRNPIRIDGTINAARGGIALVGKNISTGAESMIATQGGSVNIAGTDQAIVTFDGDKLISFAVPKDVAATAQQSGALPSGVARDAVSGVVNLGGAIVANAFSRDADGTVIIGQAVPNGIKISADKVIANGLITAPGQTVAIGGKNIAVGATIDVSAEKAGTILIGGGWQGAPLEVGPNSQKTDITGSAVLRANGGEQGGTIAIWSDHSTTVAGTISANGAAQGGNIETSGKVNLAIADNAKITASGVKPGSWLLDPLNITVGAGGATLPEVADTGDTTNTRTINASLLNTAGATVTLAALGSLSFASAVAMTTTGVGLNILANNITVGASISTNNGNIRVRNFTDSGAAATFTRAASANISTGTGTIDISANTISFGNGSLTSAALTINAPTLFTNASGSNLTPTGNVTITGGTLSFAASSILTSGGDITMTSTANTMNSGTISSSNANGVLMLTSSVNINNTGAGALIQSGGSGMITINATSIANLSGKVSTGPSGSLTITGNGAINTSGTLSSGTVIMNGVSGVNITNPTTLEVANNATINTTVDSSSTQPLTLMGTGTVSFTQAIGSSSPILTLTSANPVFFGGDVTASSSIILNQTSPSVIGSNQTWTANTFNIIGSEVNSATPGAYSLTIAPGAGPTLLGTGFGFTSALASFTLNNTSSGTLGMGAKATGNITLTSSAPFELLGAYSLQSTGGAINITNAINGTQNLAVNAATGLTFGGALGGGTPLASLNITSGASFDMPGAVKSGTGTITTTGAAVVTLTGSQSFSGDVSIMGASNFNGVNFNAAGLDANGLTTIAGSTIAVTGSTLALGATSTGSVSFAGNSFLNGGASNGLNIRGPMSMASGSTLATNFTGNAHFGPISMADNTPILTINGGGSADISGLNAGTISIGGTNRTITMDGTVTGTLAGFTANSIAVEGTGLTLNPSGSTTFKQFSGTQPLSLSAVGGSITISTLNMTGASTVNASNTIIFQSIIGTGSLTTTASSGNISFTSGSSTVGALLATASAGNISNTGAITASGAVDLTASGTVTLNAGVATTTGSLSLTGSKIVLSGNVSSATTVAFNGPVVLNSTNTSITNNTGANFAGTINGSTAYTKNLFLNGAGTVTLGGAVGGTTPLASFNRSGGTTLVNGPEIKAGSIAFGANPTVLGVDTSLTFQSDLTLNGPIDATNPGSAGLALDGGGTAIVNFNNGIGGMNALKFLSITNLLATGTSALLGANISAEGNINLGAHSFSLGGGGNAIVVNNGTLTLPSGGAIDGSTALTLTQTGTGSLNLQGAIGFITPLVAIQLTDGSAAAMTTYDVRASNIMVTAPNTTIKFANALTLGGTLNLAGSAIIDVDVSASSIVTASPITVSNATLNTTGANGLSLTDNVTLSAASISSAGSALTLGGSGKTVSVSGNSNVSGSGAITIGGNVDIVSDTFSISQTGGSVYIGSLIGAGSTVIGGTPTATVIGAVNSTGNVSFGFTGRTVTIGGNFTANQIDGLDTASGNTLNVGAVGRTITTTGANLLDIGLIAGTATNVTVKAANDLKIGSVSNAITNANLASTTGTVTVTGTVNMPGTLTINGQGIDAQGTIGSTGAMTLSATNSLNIVNPVSGTGSVTLDRQSPGDIYLGGSGAGLQITAATPGNFGSRALQIGSANTGTLQINDSVSFGGSTTLVASSLVKFSSDAPVANVEFANGSSNIITAPNIMVAMGATVGQANNFNLTANGNIDDQGLIKAGTGTVAINGGGTISAMEAGKLTINGGSNLITVNPGVYNVPVVSLSTTNQLIDISNASFAGTLSANTGAASLNLNNVTVTGTSTFNGNAVTFTDGNYTGTSSITGPIVMGGNVTFAANTTFGSVTQNSALTLNTTGATTITSLTQNGFTLNIPGQPLTINGTSNLSGTITAGGAIALNGSIVLPGNLTVDGGSSNISGTASFGGPGNLSLTTGNPGNISLSGAIGSAGTPIGSLTVTGDSVSLTGTVYSGPATLTANNPSTGTLTATNLISSGAVSFTGLSMNSNVVGTTLDLYGPGTLSPNGTITGTIGGFAGNNFVTVHQGTPPSSSILFNGADATIAVTTATVATTASVASTPSVASIAATIASTPSVAFTPTIGTTPTAQSVVFVPSSPATTPPVPVNPAPAATQLAPITQQPVLVDLTTSFGFSTSSILNQILAPQPAFSITQTGNFTIANETPSGIDRNMPINSSAAQIQAVINALPAGSLIPILPAFVPSTGSPIANSPTVKLDAADTGGPGGQAIASENFAARGVPSNALLGGMLSQQAKKIVSGEPPLEQQPSTMNEEPMMD